jgi:hypothetical protein
MIHLQKTAVAITLSSLLVACGSSGGGSDKTPTPPPTYDFTISAKVINKCGVEQPVANVDFFLQDAQWTLVSAHKTDVNGQVKVTTTDQKINYTMAKEELNGNNVVSQVELRSYIGVNSASQATIIFDNPSLADNTNCECNVQSLDLSYSRFDSVESTHSSTNFENSEVISGLSSRFNNVEVCRIKEQSWPQESFTVFGLNSQNKLIGFSGFSNNFDEIVDTNWALSAFEPSIQAEVDHTLFETLTTAQLYNDKLHFVNEISDNTQDAVIFDNHEFSNQSTYYGRATNTFKNVVNRFNKLIIKSEHIRLSSSYDDSIALSPSLEELDVDTINFSEIKADDTYDYSKIANYPAIHFITTVDTQKSSTSAVIPAVWHVYGPITGLLPIMDDIDAYKYIKIDINTVKNQQIEFIGSDLTQSYSAYINALSQGKHYQTTGVLSNYRRYFIEKQ